MPLDPAAQELLEELLQLYRQAQASIIDQLVAAATDTAVTAAPYRSRVAALARAVTEAMADLDGQAREWVQSNVPRAYELGAGSAAGDVGTDFTWSQIHREAVQVLAGDTLEDLLAATRYVRRDTKAFIREAARSRARSVLLEGDTAKQAARRLVGDLRERGISAVTYKNGARHGLADYSDVVLRTRTATIFNAGTLNVGREHGIRWVRVADGPTCGWDRHDSGDTANGSVRTLDDAEAHPISHPRCGRAFSLLPVRTREDAERVAAGDFTAVEIVAPEPPRHPRLQAKLDQREKRLADRAARVRRSVG